jgi:hypothetical protein
MSRDAKSAQKNELPVSSELASLLKLTRRRSIYAILKV